ncbi:MAG: hypothetical protein ACLTCB_08055 [Merdibacter sp.]
MGADLNALTMKMADPAASRMPKEGQRLFVTCAERVLHLPGSGNGLIERKEI